MDEVRAQRWYAAWNSRDPKAIAALYAEDVEFSSPFVAALGFGLDGVIHGREAFVAYLAAAMPRMPELALEPVSVFIGARGEVLLYKIHTGALIAETHEYDEAGLILRADAAYEIEAFEKGGEYGGH